MALPYPDARGVPENSPCGGRTPRLGPHREVLSHSGCWVAGDPEDHEEPKSEEKGPRVSVIFISLSCSGKIQFPTQPGVFCPLNSTYCAKEDLGWGVPFG